VDEIIDGLFATPKQIKEWVRPHKIPQPVGFPQMIDLLTDLWKAGRRVQHMNDAS